MPFGLAISCAAVPNTFQFTTSGTSGAGKIIGLRLSGQQFGLTWATLYTFTGDENSGDIVLEHGVWVITAVQNDGELAPLYNVHVLDPADPLAIQSRSLVANAIRSAALDPFSAIVYEMQTPIDYLKTYPATYVTLNDTIEQDEGTGTNLRTHWIYPVKVMLAIRNDARINDRDAKEMLAARQLLIEGFDWMVPGNDTSIEYCRVAPGPQFQQYVFNAGGNEHLVTASVFTVNCHTRRARGFPN